MIKYDKKVKRSPTILLKFDAGARYPLLNHRAGEGIFVLEGDIHLGNGHLFAGDSVFTAPNNLHAVRTESGCAVLL